MSGRFPRMPAVTPLPGARVGPAAEWIEILVMPQEEPGPYVPSPQRDRSLAHKAACEDSRQFRDRVLSFLQARHLMGAVRWISEPGSLPMVTLYGTPRVLEQLQQAPQFEAGRTTQLEMYT